jgi:hypothetical protein
MAALSITPADVQVTSTSNQETRIVATGVTVTAGSVCTLDSNGKVILAECDSSTNNGGQGLYIALSGATASQPVVLARPGTDITISSVMTTGIFYYLSATAGSIIPVADLVSTNYVTQLGYAKSATVFSFSPTVTGLTKP